MKRRMTVIGLITLLSLMVVSVTQAQYTNPWYTSYQVVNVGENATTIAVDYYDSDGNIVTAAHRDFTDVAAGGSVLVLQYDETALGNGAYSAVISAGEPIAAITNQQTNPSGEAWSGTPPFSTYSGEGQGTTKVTLPAVMYNWYNYYTEIFIMNVGDTAATDVDITYVPGTMDVGSGPESTGSNGTENDNSIPQYATLPKSQESLTALGAASGTFTGRFLGSAIIEADQPIIVVVNQHNTTDQKLMTYNGFTSGATKLAAPSYMRGYYGYYTTMLVANPDVSASAAVTITYIPNTSEAFYNEAEAGSTIGTVVVTRTVAPQESLTRFDGATATDGQSDLDDHDTTGHAFTKFFGSVIVESDIGVMVQVNVEAAAGASAPAQAGSYNGIAVSGATTEIVAPVILADFYGFYTTMIVQNTTATAGSCTIAYTSDGTYSDVKNHTESYTHALAANASFTVYEGHGAAGNLYNGDINNDSTWGTADNRRFIGAAKVTCSVPVVAFVNEEKDTNGWDSMYTMNTFNQ